MNVSFDHVSRSFAALFISQYGGMVFSMISSLALTRLLVPEDFGAIAIYLFYFTVFNWMGEWGWESAMLMHPEIELDQAAGSLLAVRVFLSGIPFVVALIGLWWGYGSLVLVGLAFAYWIERIGFVYRTVLERLYRLRPVARVELSAVAISYAVAVGAALTGLGVYSLVIQRLVEKGSLLVGYMSASPWRGGIAFRQDVIVTFLKNTGLAAWVSSFVALPLYDFMPFLIGKLTTVSQAGLYVKAFTLATFPLMLTGIFSRLTTPLYAAHQGQVAPIKRIFLRAQTIKAFILIPAQIVLGLSASWWIPRALGIQWAAVVPIYQVLTIYGLVRAFYDDVPNVLMYGFKSMWPLTKNQAVQAVGILVSGPLLVMSGQGLGGAWCMSGVMVVGAFLFWKQVMDVLGCTHHDFVEGIVGAPAWVKERVIKR